VCKTGVIHLRAAPGHRRAIKNGVWFGKLVLGEPVEFNVVAGGRALQSTVIKGVTDFAFQVEPATQFDRCAGVVSSGGSGGDGTETGLAPGAAYQIAPSVFVAPTGTFNNTLYQFGDSQQVTGRFTGRTAAAGTFNNPPQACGPWGWTAFPE